jgi:hypothetical protein
MLVKNSNSEYHGGAGISSSGLKLLSKSPLHYAYKYLSGNAEARTAALSKGSALHCAALEPHLFADQFVVRPDGIDGRTKDGKAWLAENSEREILSAQDGRDISGMANSIRQHERLSRILAMPNSHAETSIYWRDEATGAECKCRPDFMIEPCEQFRNGLIVDLKTTASDATPDGFSKTASNYQYALSAYFYAAGFQAHFQTADLPPFVFAVVENYAPYSVALFRASLDVMQLGFHEVRHLLELYASCLESGKWPSYDGKINDLQLPAWDLRRLEILENGSKK